MSLKLTVSPAYGSVLPLTGELSFTVEGVDPQLASHDFLVTLDATTIYRDLNGVVTLEPGWTAVASSPDPTTKIVRLYPTAPLPDPTELTGSFDYVQGAPNESKSESLAFLYASTSTIFYPSDGQGAVIPDADIHVRVSSASVPVNDVEVSLDGTLAVSTTSNPTYWNAPEQTGVIASEPGAMAAFVKPRRRFRHGARVSVTTTAYLPGPSQQLYAHRASASWSVQNEPAPQQELGDAVLTLHLPFAGRPASEAFRRALMAAVVTPATKSPFDVLCYLIAQSSQLRPLLTEFYSVKLTKAAAVVLPADRANSVAVDAALQRLAILWRGALTEAQRSGLQQSLLDVLDRYFGSSYPADRNGAVALLMLWLSQH